MHSQNEKTAQFPRGLHQPERGFRFAVDSLLLACFAPIAPKRRVLDLGSGCGVIGLALLLRDASLAVTGLERDSAMLECARENASLLGLEHHYASLPGDVRQAGSCLHPESFDLVVCNPPFRIPGQGRSSPVTTRNQALFELHGGLEDFITAAAFAVANKGHVCLVHVADRLVELLTLLRGHRLEPKRLCAVQGRAQTPSKLILVEARKNGAPGLMLDPALVLYNDDGALSSQALAFCPFLACNQRRMV